jgi:hypothetical protein
MRHLNKFRNEGSFDALTEVHFPKAVQAYSGSLVL